MLQHPVPSSTVQFQCCNTLYQVARYHFNVLTHTTKLHGTISMFEHPVPSCTVPFQCLNTLYLAARSHFNVWTPCTKLHGTISCLNTLYLASRYHFNVWTHSTKLHDAISMSEHPVPSCTVPFAMNRIHTYSHLSQTLLHLRSPLWRAKLCIQKGESHPGAISTT